MTKEAASWFLKAAEKGNENAQFHLGEIYADGRGVVQDYVQAYKWLNISSLNGSNNATRSKKSLLEKMNQQQISEAQEDVRKWMLKKNNSSSTNWTKAN